MELYDFKDDSFSVKYGILKSKEQPKKLLFLVHGYGADCFDLEPFAIEIQKHISGVECILPNGFDRCDADSNYRQWFAMNEWNIDAWKLSIRAASSKFDKFLNFITRKYGFTNKDVILLGFSQGTMMSIHVGVQNGVAGVLAYSGLIVDDTILDNKKEIPEILMVHGDADTVVPLSSMINSLDIFKENGFEVKSEIIPKADHMIESKGLLRGIDFIKNLV